ncbi:type IV pili methyl-accepting chemotaxis transducer N-terminal domain-containing protein [Hahella sp. CR1]|uniref:type IV pili methyl-accepting chemotaxis transducer N-terminal domain-containing protein n=1 Tax=unclassified Hahella TaxID=2624107 RepID=UPI0024413F26|nr:type IV pili methyl-accepting chemotaxis transducer N-terminal domain-containing protein [Hahella sp. CR1]MDG9668983.1 type IV pili methyl-accepting chemotaxis transducer N-terminal domain-containing protein [Hahella sp. CR1]
MRHIRNFSLLVLSLLALSWSHIVIADITDLDEAINKAGRQRMLSQRIVKSYLLMGQDIQPDKSSSQLTESVALFEQQLGELEAYSKSPQISGQLKSVRKEWTGFRQLATAKPAKDKAIELINAGERVLALSNKIVQSLEQQSGSPKNKMINLSGRQRMLSQRIALYYSALSWNLEQADLQDSFTQAVQEYDQALHELRQAKINNQDINAALDKVISQWSFSRSGFQLMQGQNFVPFIIATTTEGMLKNMERITGLYENLQS